MKIQDLTDFRHICSFGVDVFVPQVLGLANLVQNLSGLAS
jgi:hypothetical protein